MVTEPNEFMQKLQELQDSTEVTYSTLPSDEPRFIIDANTRSITIPPEFQFLGVKNDHKAETIYFEIDRYFDAVDLSTHTCVVQFSNSSNSGLYPVTVMDTETVDGKIIFGWEIMNDVTAIVGNINFSVRFYSVDENSQFIYNFNTLTANSVILDTLDVDNPGVVENYPSELEAWLDRMNDLSQNVVKPEDVQALDTKMDTLETSFGELETNVNSSVDGLKGDLDNLENTLKFNLGGIYNENNVALSNSTYVFLNTQNNSRKVNGFKFYANEIGRLYYYHFKDDGDGKIYTDKINYFDVENVGINFVKLDIELRENEYLGFSSRNEILTYANVPINSHNQIGVRQEVCYNDAHYTFTSFIKTNYALNVEVIFDDSLITRVDNLEINNFDFLRCFTSFTGIGDSLMGGYTSYGNNTVGTAIAREKKNNWLEYMCSRLNRECHNLAVGSSTAENWRYVNQSGINESDIEKANITTSCYIIGIGVNDLRLNNIVGTNADIKNDYTQNSNTFYGNYDYLIRKMKSFNPYAKIFALTIPRSETGEKLEYINNAIRYICSLYTNVYCIDLNSIPNYDREFIANNFSNGHYNPITYNYMSVIIENEINKYIYNNYDDFKWIPYDFN